MAGSALLEKEIEKMTGNTQELTGRTSEEEIEHQRMMSQNFKELFETPSPAPSYEEYSPAPSAYYHAEETHAPVVPNSPEAPSASSRIADYMSSARSLQELRMRSEQEYPRDYAGVSYAPAEEYEEYDPSVEEYLYQEGILMDASLAPEKKTVEAPVFSPSYMPETPVLPDEDDARPTRRTLEYTHSEETERDSRLSVGLSGRTKIILGAIAAAVVLLLAIICINTAVIKSINSGVALRESTVAGLSEQLSGIESEIRDITSPEYVENWAAEHGMTPPES